MYRGMGAVDVSGSSWCGSGNPFVDFFCSEDSKKSITEQVITDTSDYGGHLSQASRDAAEQMAREAIAADDPCNYSEINQMGWIDKLACDAKEKLLGRGKPKTDFTLVALAIAAVATVAVLKS